MRLSMATPIQSANAMPAHDLTRKRPIVPHQLFEGTTWHSRLLPSINKFVYPYRYWGGQY